MFVYSSFLFLSTYELHVDLSHILLQLLVLAIEILRLEIVVPVIQSLHVVDFFLADQLVIVNFLRTLLVAEEVLDISIRKFRNIGGFMAPVCIQSCLDFLLLILNLGLRLFKSLVVFHVVKNILVELTIPILFLQMLHETKFEIVDKSQIFVYFSEALVQTFLMK